jgi:hypothetical protein
MLSKFFTILAALVLVSSLTLGGNHVKAKAPHRVADDVPARTLNNDGPLPPMVSALGPGDSIAFTYYDYSTNGSTRPGLINYGDGTLSFASMASDDGGVTGWTNRGSWYKYYDGTSWSAGWSRVELVRRGWTSMAQIADAGGVEVILSHAANECNVDAAKGANTWSSTITGHSQIWPRIAIGNGFTIHGVGTPNPPDVLWYFSSPDAGTTWSAAVSHITTPGHASDADAYNITAQGDKVAYVSAAAGGDVIVVESMDGGATWTENLIYDIDETGFTAGQEPADGSCDIVYDSNGNLHVAWGSYLYIGDGAAYLTQDAGIRHWSAASGVQEIALADPDTNIVHHGLTDGDYISHPALSADASGNVFVVYYRFINEQDDSSNYYQHVFGRGSSDGGMSWSGEYEMTPGTGFDGTYPIVADLVDDYVHFVYYCDAFASNALQGGHGDIQVAFMYHMVSALDILNTVGVREVTDVIPDAYRLEQNYPNPFNPTTNIRYSIPQNAFVTLTVFDMLGREVATLVNQEQAAGSYVADFNAASLANGTYFYKIQAGNFSETRKMMVLK